MKIVVNKCYGGFGISLEALKELVKRNAACVESCTPKHYYGGDNDRYYRKDEWEQKWNEDFKEFEDIGDGFMADKRSQYNVYKDGLLYSLKSRSENDMRTDKDLVDVVEKMGEAANGWAAKLRIVDVPDDIQWEIDDYDGIETVHELHRSW